MPFVASPELPIYYEDTGTGPPVLLLHSFLCSGAMWQHQVEALVAQGYRVINVDHRGHGRSGLVRRGYNLEAVVADTIAVLDALALPQATWAGLSIGGMVALRAALTHRDRIQALILINTSADAELLRLKLKYRALGAATRLVGVRPLVPLALPLMFGSQARAQQPSMVNHWATRIAAADPGSMLATLEALLGRRSVRHELRALHCPSLVLSGKADKAIPPRVCRAIASAIPDAELREFDGVGHLATLEDPAAINAAMLQFLRSQVPVP